MMAELVVKATVVLALGWCAAFVLRGRAASTRHSVWAGVLAAVLMLPVIGAFAPSIDLPLLPAANERAAQGARETAPVRELSIFTDAPAASGQSRVALDPIPAASAPTPSWYASLSAGQIAVAAWLAVAMLLALRVIVAHIQARALLRACADPGERLTRAVEDVARALRIRTPPVRVAASGMMPAVIGIARPSLVMPSDADRWSDERLELVLRHECAHVRRRDTLMQAVSHAATAAYWWHPLAWIAARNIVRERELACDDLVIASGTPAERYAEHLLDIARSMKGSRQPALAALAMARTSQLEGRLISLLDDRPRGSKPSRAMAAGIGLAIVAGLAIAPIRLVARAVVAPDVIEPAGAQAQAAAAPQASASQTAAVAPAPVAQAAPAAAPQANPALNAALLKAMSDTDEDVRAMAAATLATSGGTQPQVTAALLNAMKDSSDDVRRAALAGLIRLHSDEVIPHLAQAIKDRSEDVRTLAIAGIAVLDHPDARALLLPLTRDDSEDVRSLVAMALASQEGRDVSAALAAMARDASADVRASAVMAIASQKHPDSIALLTQALRDASEDVRAAAAIALGSIGDQAGIGALTTAMSDPHADVRKAAIAGIGAINGEFKGITTVASTVAGTIAATIHGTLWGGSGYVWAGPAQAQPQEQQPKKMVQVIGHVKNPGDYDWEEGLTAGKLIAKAGGLTGRGTMRNLTIRRTESGKTFELGAREATAVQPGDQLIVAQRRW